MVKSETKPNNLIPVSKEYFDKQVEKELDILVYKELRNNRDSKGLIDISKSDVLGKKLRPTAIKLVSCDMRVKGTRTGHINHAPESIQNKYNQAKELLTDCNWTTDGIEYTVNLIAKKVVVAEKVEA